MGVPKRRTSPAKRGQRRAHKKLDSPNFSVCPQCHEPLLPHHICPHCGTYKGREILKTVEEK